MDKKEKMHCLEIGSFEGRSTIYTVENFCNGKDSYVDAVDTWEGSVEHTSDHKEQLYDRFLSNTKQYVDIRKINIYRGYSGDILTQLLQEVKNGKREQYDFIYIDGSHMAKDVLLDAVLAWELLKNNGIMIFDDYKWKKFLEPEAAPEIAINGFLDCYKQRYEILYNIYQVHIKKTDDQAISITPIN